MDITKRLMLKRFCLVNFRDFIPGITTIQDKKFFGASESWKIIGNGVVDMHPYLKKPQQKYIIIQSFSIPADRYAVTVPDDMVIGSSVTFLQKRKRRDSRIQMNQEKKKARICLYPCPKTGVSLRWDESLVYTLKNRKWVLSEVDGRSLEK